MALSNLEVKGYIKKERLRGNKYNYIYKKEFDFTKEELEQATKDDNFTLANQLVKKIQTYLEKTYRYGDRILSNQAFSNMFSSFLQRKIRDYIFRKKSKNRIYG